MPVLAGFGLFESAPAILAIHRQFTPELFLRPFGRALGVDANRSELVEDEGSGVGPWTSVRYALGADGGVRPVIRAANSSAVMRSHAAPAPMVWSSIHLQLSTRVV